MRPRKLQSDDSSSTRPSVTLAIKFAAPLCGFTFLIALFCLWQAGQSGFVLKLLHVIASNYHQFTKPFADAYGLIAVIECNRLGIDIYASNPCDLYNRPHVYSSVWLLGSSTKINTTWTPEVGCVLAFSFALSLFLLPPSRSARQAIIMVLGVLSNAVIFAVYQGNNDLIVFALCAIAGSMLLYSIGFRFVAYALFIFAASLKFYPVSLMIVALREKFVPFILATFMSFAALIVFIYVYGADTIRVLKIIPTGKITQMFGSSVIAQGIAGFPYEIRNSTSVAASSQFGTAIMILLLIVALAFAVTIVCLREVRDAIASLTRAEGVFLSIGCVLLVACFFTGESYRYRAIYFLFALPALTFLFCEARTRPVQILFGATVSAIIFLLWSINIGNGMDYALSVAHVPDAAGSLIFAAFWLLRELTWWGVISVLIAALGCLIYDFEMTQWILRCAAQLFPSRSDSASSGS